MGFMNLIGRNKPAATQGNPGEFIERFSMEVTPKTMAKALNFSALVPVGTRIYVAHIAGTPIDDMVMAARNLSRHGYQVMPHIPARSVPDRKALGEWLRRYRDEAGIDSALVLAGGLARPVGVFENSMQLLETGLFEEVGYKRLHIAGHPEGNKDIDPDGTTRIADAAILSKQDFARSVGIDMAIVTQFLFDSVPLIAWADRLQSIGVTLPVHAGIAGPAKLQTLLKYAATCGVGPSVKVLQRRAGDLARLILPFEPTDLLTELAAHKAEHADCLIEAPHFFPLGGISKTAEWLHSRIGDR